MFRSGTHFLYMLRLISVNESFSYLQMVQQERDYFPTSCINHDNKLLHGTKKKKELCNFVEIGPSLFKYDLQTYM